MKKTIRKTIAAAVTVFLITSSVPQVFADDLPGGVTRGEFVAAINEAYGIYNVIGKKPSFTDIAIGDTYYFDMMAAGEAGVFSGYPDGTAAPLSPITRAEAATMLTMLLELEPAAPGTFVSDAADIPAWAGNVSAVISAGLMSTDNGVFHPNSPVSEEELAQIKVAVSNYPGGHSDEIKEIPSFDDHVITGKLSMPNGVETVDKLVIFVHGTGANTYNLSSESLEYGVRLRGIDIYSNGFLQNGTAFFSYNTRGVTIGQGTGWMQPDAVIDTEAYRSYTPQNSARDIQYMIDALKAEPRLKDAEVFLLGVSEGTVIAPFAVKEYGAEADALLLAGYCNENMNDVLRYQLGGEMSFFNYSLFFNTVGEDSITKEQFEADPNKIRETVLQGAAFEDIDINADGVLTLADFQIMLKPIEDGLFTAVENGDDQWIAENMSAMMPQLMTDWFKAHAELPKTEDTMAALDLPLYIFQGTYDANCPVQGTYDVQARFEALGKENLTVHIYEGYPHDLNINQELMTGDSEAFDDMFETVETFE